MAENAPKQEIRTDIPHPKDTIYTRCITRVLAVAKTLATETGRSEIDGFRIEYAEGWVSVRQSNTEPLLRLIVECDTRARMASWLAALSAAIAEKGPSVV